MYDQLSVFMLSSVRFKFAVLALVPVFLTIGGCGGSGASSSSSTTTQAASTSASSTSSASTTSTASTQSKRSSTAPQNVRIPVRFEIGAAGKLTPPQIAVPAKLPIELTFVSKDGRTHEIVVLTTALHVPAGGQASKLIPGPKAGRYPIKLDGVAAGLLITGVNPGP